MVPGKDYIPVLTRVISSKRDHYGNLSGDPNNKLILDTIIYELESTYWRVEEYLVNTVLENLLKQFHGDWLHTGILSETISFSSDPNVATQKGDDSFHRVNNNENMVVTTKG